MEQAPKQRFTYRDYCQWDGDERWELIDGQVYDMSPAPSRRHQAVVTELAYQIRGQLDRGHCQVYVAPFDVRFPDGDEADEDIATVVQPDISVICELDRLDDKGCRGAPTWIVEILSARTAAKDQIRKRELYERHGVLEYWLVDPDARIVTAYRLEQGGYGVPQVQELKGTLSATSVNITVDWDAMQSD